jgi:hypothetical protein
MAYETKPGQFNLFKNEEKTDDKQPDYKGKGMALDGTECWISAWVKRPEGKKPYFSISIQPKVAKQNNSDVVKVVAEVVSDGLPF